MLAVCALALAFTVGACSPKEQDGRKTLRFFTWKPNQPEVWDEIIALFEKEHPQIRVVREVGPHSSTAFHDLLAQKLKNRSRDLDVFFMDVIWPAEFAAAGWAMALDDHFPAEEREAYLEGAIRANTYKGKIYGLPLYIDSGMLYYRKDLLDQYGMKPPATWPEMVRQAQRIAEKEPGLYGFSAQFRQYEGLVCNMMEFILGNGGHLVSPETGKAAVAEKRAVDAVGFVRDEIVGKIAPRGILTYAEPESLALFIQGRAVFHRNWPYAWEISNNPDRSKIAGKVGVAPLPHFAGGKSHATLGGWQVGISNYSDNKETAWTFARYLSSGKIQKHLALRAGLAPTRKALYQDGEVLRACPQFTQMRHVFLTATPRPGSPLYPALSNILQRYFSKALSDPRPDLAREAAIAAAEMDRILALAP
jgi:multiple sugar transport system substrate-binding protein